MDYLTAQSESPGIPEALVAFLGFLFFAFAFLIVPLLPILIGGLVGTFLERKHYEDLACREEATRHLVISDLATPPPGLEVGSGVLVDGSVVIAPDHFRSLRARFRKLIGGEFKGLVKIQERARREALMRMKEKAIALGAVAIANVRVETSTISGNRPDSVAGAEIIASGTALIPEVVGSLSSMPPSNPVAEGSGGDA